MVAAPAAPLLLILLLCAGATIALASLALLAPLLPKRENFAGHKIPTSAGLAFIPIILGMLAASLLGWIRLDTAGLAYLAYSLLAGLVGFADDSWGGGGGRGFRGHVGALLLRGSVSTGLWKVVFLGGGGLAFGVGVFGVGWRALAGAFLLAGCANLANLFDVRPGRALKFVGVPALVLMLVAPSGAVLAGAGVVGGALALFYFDLKGRIMLGDAGAAIWGALLGYLAVMSGPGVVWWVGGVVIAGLTAVAEFSSISRIIGEVGALRRLDLWGRADG